MSLLSETTRRHSAAAVTEEDSDQAKPAGPAEQAAPVPITIPFNRPSFDGNEARYLAQALTSGHTSGDGPFTKRCHAFLEQALGVPKALLTTSCTHALEMAALLLDI